MPKRQFEVGNRVVITSGYSKGEHGEIINRPGMVFTGWTVKLDNGRIFGAGSWEMKLEPVSSEAHS